MQLLIEAFDKIPGYPAGPVFIPAHRKKFCHHSETCLDHVSPYVPKMLAIRFGVTGVIQVYTAWRMAYWIMKLVKKMSSIST